MGIQDTKEFIRWRALLSTLQELKAELLQQHAALRVERSAALMDFAWEQTRLNRAKLNDLNTHLTVVAEALTDLAVTMTDVECQAEESE